MKQIVAVLFLCVTTVLNAQSLEKNPEIENTIQSQINAFLVDDFDTAFTFASPNIQSIFGSSERFGSMVKNGYPMVWRPSEVTFLDLNQKPGGQFQKVMMRDATGRAFVLEYIMIETQLGWRIDGVRILPDQSIGA